MHLLNRSSLVLSPKQAYLDWVKNLPLDTAEKPADLADLQLQTAIYLIDEIEQESQLVSAVDANWRDILSNELSIWDEFLDESPQMTRAVFDDFFTVRVQLVVADASSGALMRADLNVD